MRRAGCAVAARKVRRRRVDRRRGKWKRNVVALNLGLDLSTPQGELVANVIASVAQWERRIIGERIGEELAVKKAQGVRIVRPATITLSIYAHEFAPAEHADRTRERMEAAFGELLG